MAKLSTLLHALLLTTYIAAQPGTLDPTFDPLAGPNNWVYCMVEQPDGKVIIGGDFTSYNGVPRNRIARINQDGSLDTSFDPGTGADGTVNALALQPDGRVVVGGWFNTFNGAARNRIVRLNVNGTVDASFSVGNGFNSYVEVVRVLADGRILVGGAFWVYDGDATGRLAMLQANGSLDQGFTANMGSGANYAVKHLAVMADGRIAVGGEFTTWNGVASGGMVMLNANGSTSGGFSVGTGANASVWTVLPLPDGGLLVGGDFTSWNGVPRTRLVRLQSNGALDAAWGSATGTSSTVRHLFRQADGRIVAAGSFTSLFGAPRVRVARLLSDGTVEPGFDPGTGPNLDVETAAMVADDRILIGGNFSNYGGTPRVRLARIKACLPAAVSLLDATLTASSPTGPYQWIDCGTSQNIPGANGQSFTPTANGSYAVNTTSNGCSITSACVNVTTVGVGSVVMPGLRVWPVPASDQLRVECPGHGWIELLSMDGTLLLTTSVRGGVNVLQVDHLASGAYLLRFRDNGIATVRVVMIDR
ncbi:MAG: hypothetical protein KIT10_05935 [Flavobacteriales bacterium]|nr:hypothetical protein [Flavobacteriales bacterium]